MPFYVNVGTTWRRPCFPVEKTLEPTTGQGPNWKHTVRTQIKRRFHAAHRKVTLVWYYHNMPGEFDILYAYSHCVPNCPSPSVCSAVLSSAISTVVCARSVCCYCLNYFKWLPSLMPSLPFFATPRLHSVFFAVVLPSTVWRYPPSFDALALPLFLPFFFFF